MTEDDSWGDSLTSLIGPFGPSPDLNPALWEPMDCDRCHQPITLADEWFHDADGAYHGGCLVG